MVTKENVMAKLSEKKRELRYLNERIDELYALEDKPLVIEQRIKMVQRIMRVWGAIEGIMRIWYDGEDYMLEINKIDTDLRQSFHKPIVSNTETVEFELEPR